MTGPRECGAAPAAVRASELSDEQLGQAIMSGLYDNGLFRTWYRHEPKGWTLVSGLWSPVYLQLRELLSHPRLLALAGEAVARLVRREVPDATCLVGVAFAGIPLAVAASLASDVPAAMTRKHRAVEGALLANSRIVIVDDLVTGFDSKLSAAMQVEHEIERRGLQGVRCEDVVVLIDREQGGSEAAAARGFRLHALIALPSQGLEWLRPRLAPVEHEVLSEYFADPSRFQHPDARGRLHNLALTHLHER
jgi:orotate phosphoribosyltransferase